MQGSITTRPERTSEEIAADRKEGIAFFARVYTGSVGRRDLERMIAYHSYAENLVQVTMEGESWWRTHQPSTQARKARTAELQAMATLMDNPDPNAPRYYVSEADRNLLPPPAIHPRPRTIRGRQERRKQLNIARDWFKQLDVSSRERSRRIARILREKDASFNQWLLNPANWRYGPVREEVVTPNKLPREAKYRGPRQFHPAGLSAERALEIAAAVLDQDNTGQ